MNRNKFRQDYYRLRGTGSRSLLPIDILFRHNIRFMLYFRKFKAARTSFGKLFYRFALYRMSRKYGLEFSPNAEIGGGMYLCHPYNITVGNGTVIGRNCSLYKGCTLGVSYRGSKLGAPHLGDNVFVGLNASLIGAVEIGDDVLIAPNAYVNFDVPPHSIVIGNPARIIHRDNATDGYIFNQAPNEA